MRILATQYNVNLKALEIYTAGCKGNPHCEDCHNPESWDFALGDEYNEDYFNKIKSKVEEFDLLIDNIMVLGGEPLDNPLWEVVGLLKQLNTLNKKIWLFTGYEMHYLSDVVIEQCDYIKVGRYDKTKLTDNNKWFGINLASSNQYICGFDREKWKAKRE